MQQSCDYPEFSTSAGAPFLTSAEATQQLGFARHDLRIARILLLSEALGRPLSVSYLDSCDVRALPVLLQRLEQAHAQRNSSATGLWRALHRTK